MAFEIVLGEDDFRNMPPELRDKLLKWYFDQKRPTPSSHHNSTSGPINPAGPVLLRPMRKKSGRVSFYDFLHAGLLAPGTEIKCKTLKRQKHSGAEPYIEAGKVLEDGSVDYNGQHYIVPSKLAVDAVNANGGKTKALNGYDYLFIQEAIGLVSFQELRKRYNDKL